MPDPPVEKWEDFFRKYYQDKIVQLAKAYPEKRSLHVYFSDVDQYDSKLADALLEWPDQVLPAAEEALRSMDTPTGVTLEKAHLRIIEMPKDAPTRVQIRDLRSHHISRLIPIEGLVRKVTEVRPKLVEAAFECPSGHITKVPQTGSKYTEPYLCPECDRKTSFKINTAQSTFVDAQKIRLQESPEELRGGEQPQTLDVNVEDDLAGFVVPGDRVVITGILRSHQRSSPAGKSTYFDIYIEGVSIEMEEQEFEKLEITKEDEKEIYKLRNDPKIYQRVVQSITPTIYGYEDVKEAMALQLFSGVVKNLPDGSRIRGDIHLLLIGDPGTGKSQLLRYIVTLAPRGIYTSGKSSTAAGLTATAVKDEFGEGQWTLEAGALVIADGGIAAVDEMDKMRTEDRSALHEAMEQQTISVAKAGIMATLKSRCALLGAANPKEGRFNRYDPIAVQIDMPPTLLSRFDLIFPLMDRPSEAQDDQVSSHILKSHYAGELDAHARHIESGAITEEQVSEAMASIQPEIEPGLLRKYVAYAKSRVYPIMSKEALAQFKEFYVGLRRLGEGKDSPVPVTARELEALVRLGEASARVRLSDEVTEEDADRVINIVRRCLEQVGTDTETGMFDTDIIHVGISQSQRDKIRTLRAVIKELEHEHGGAAPRDDVLDRAEEMDIDRDKAEELLARLKRQGDVFEPKPNMYKLA